MLNSSQRGSPTDQHVQALKCRAPAEAGSLHSKLKLGPARNGDFLWLNGWPSLDGGWPTPLKNMSQLGWWNSQYDGKVIKAMFSNHQCWICWILFSEPDGNRWTYFHRPKNRWNSSTPGDPAKTGCGSVGKMAARAVNLATGSRSVQ